MASRLKIIEDYADIVPAPKLPESQPPHGSAPQRNRPVDDANGRSTSVEIDFTPAPTRKRRAGWTAERQRKFIEQVALTGNIGDACALVGLSSTSFYNLCSKPGAESFVAACDAARLLCASSRGSAIAWDRAVNGRVERFYKDGELVMERRVPSDYLLTWLLSRLDPVTFGSPAAKAHALAAGNPRDAARNSLPQLTAELTDVAPEDCPCEEADYIDHRLGEMAMEDEVRSSTGD